MRNSLVLLVACAAIWGCATTNTSVVMLETGAVYAPSPRAELLTNAPSRPFKAIAILETQGHGGTPMPKLLESMRDKAAAIGAHAVMPPEDASTTTPQSVMYNPFLGGYQTVGGVTVPVIRAVAIRYLD